MDQLLVDLAAVVHRHEHHREKYDLCNNDNNKTCTTPLKLDDSLDSAEGLPRRQCPHTARVSWGLRACVGRGLIIEETPHIDLDAVADRDELEHHCEGGKGQQRAPEVLQRVFVVDMTDIPKAKRNSSQAQSEC